MKWIILHIDFSATTEEIRWTALQNNFKPNQQIRWDDCCHANIETLHNFGNTAAWLSQCCHGVQWHTTIKRKWGSCLGWHLERCLCSVKLKRHNWNVSGTSGRCDLSAWEAFWHCCHFILTREIFWSKNKGKNYTSIIKEQFWKAGFLITGKSSQQQWWKGRDRGCDTLTVQTGHKHKCWREKRIL